MRSTTIKARLIIVLGALTALLIAMGVMGMNGLGKTVHGMETIYNDRVVPLEQLKVIADMYAVNVVDTSHQVRNGNFTWSQGLNNVEEAQRLIKENWNAYLGTVLVDEETRLVDQIKPLMAKADNEIEKLKDVFRRQDLEALTQFTISTLYPTTDPVSEKFADLTHVQLVVAKREFDSGQAVYQTLVTTTVVSCVIAVAIAIFMGVFLVRAITVPLAEAVELSDRIAQGNLDNNIVVSRNDETGQLLEALKRMNNQLLQTVSNVRENADAISSGAQQIASGNANLSQRTEEQASSLEETAASMEEMTSTVRQNADSAQQAAQLANAARGAAEKGGQVVERTVKAMSEINSSSTRIADIITTIDGIAFQTNLLALNAAVEAARAGEQGRGFAVVASEVRSLAQRSAEAAKEIKGLIEDSVDKVKAGSELVDESGVTLKEIVDGIKKVADIVAEINAASQEQSAGIDQVNNAVAQMDDMTQQNAALVEESAAASRSMEDQARALVGSVSFFNLGAGHRSGIYRQEQRVINELPAARSISNPGKALRTKTEHLQKIREQKAKVRSKKTGTDGSQEWEDF